MLKLHEANLGAEEVAAVTEVLQGGWLTRGPRTVMLEQAFGRLVQAPFALGLNSATSALHLALKVAGIGPGDEVIVPALTFAATANVVVHCGAKPVFADVLPDTHCIDPLSVESWITPQTKAIIPVHFAGIPCDLITLRALADEHGLFILEDCAHAIETYYDEMRVGIASGSRFAAYSFYATKNMTCGEGGMLCFRDQADYERAKLLGLHGVTRDAWDRYVNATGIYDITEAGYKYNMNDIQAAIGLVQFGRLGYNFASRVNLVRAYDRMLRRFEFLPHEDCSGLSARHLYIIKVEAARRDQVMRELARQHIETAIHYPCLTGTTFYRGSFGTDPAQTPVAAEIAACSITLPLYPLMQEADVVRVVEALRALI